MQSGRPDKHESLSQQFDRITGKRRVEMKKIYVLLLAMTVSAVSQSYRYDVKASLVGKIGEVRVTSSESKTKYSIDLRLKATGFAKSMSHNLVEHHSSHGSIRDGEYYAKEYKLVKTYKDMKYIRKYIFDYKRKKIKKVSIKWKKGKKLYEKSTTLKYFANNDAMTLYHNVLRFKGTHKAGRYGIKLAGAEKDGGRILFDIPSGKALKHAQGALGVRGLDILSLGLRRSFFSGGKGTLSLGIDSSGTTQKATLTNVKLLGTMTLYRIK